MQHCPLLTPSPTRSIIISFAGKTKQNSTERQLVAVHTTIITTTTTIITTTPTTTISKLFCNIGGNSSGSGMNLEPRCNLSFTQSTNTQPSVGGSLLAMPQPYKRNHVCNIMLSITHDNIAYMDFVQVMDNNKK